MTALDQYPLRDTAIYNPHLLSKDELIGLFAARRQLLDRLLEDLARCSRGETPQHHLLVAQRGMGKTMLLRRLQFAIEDDPKLAAEWLPLTFPEEQYNVGGLSELWLNCIDALGDALDRVGRGAEAERLDLEREALNDLEEKQRAQETLALLLGTAKTIDKRLVLLIDNIDLILERISGQAWTLREVLSEESSILLIGASSRALESSYKYDKPFYDFFHIHELSGLSLEETGDLLRHYATHWRSAEVLRVVNEEPARIRTLHNLTGGNPRTVTLLYNILGQGLEGDVRADLENLLDQCTPLYKSRLEALSPQQQRVVHALAVHWNPAVAAQVASELRLDVKAVSSQLTRLVRDGVVETVDFFDPRAKTGFQLAERFFNIWYLMRTTRRARSRMIWLVEFLKMFYSQEQLRVHALEHLTRESLPRQERLRFAEYSFALAEALREPQLRKALETNGLYTLIKDPKLRGRIAEIIDLEGDEARLRPWAEHKRRLDKVRGAILSTSAIEHSTRGKLWQGVAYSVQQLEAKERLAFGLALAGAEWSADIVKEFEREPEFVVALVGSKQVAEALQQAFAEGWMRETYDIEGARNAALRLQEPRLEIFALARRLKIIRDPRPLLADLEPYLEEVDSAAVLALWARHALRFDPESERGREILESFRSHDVRSPLILLDLAVAWLSIDRKEDASECIDKAHGFDYGEVPFFWLWAVAFAWQEVEVECRRLDLLREAGAAAETVLRIVRAAMEFLPRDLLAWYELGVLFGRQGRLSEAEEMFTKAVKTTPKSARAYLGLGETLVNQSRFHEAEAIFQKALELEPESADAWLSLGYALGKQSLYRQAEDAFRQVLMIDPAHDVAANNLAWTLIKQDRSMAEAEEFARRAAEAKPEDVLYKNNLATVLALREQWFEAFALATGFLPRSLGSYEQHHWPEILMFFEVVVSGGKAREAAEFLDHLAMADRWRPLREALETAAVGRRSYLKRLAPEVRQPTEEILEQLGWEEPVGEAS